MLIKVTWKSHEKRMHGNINQQWGYTIHGKGSSLNMIIQIQTHSSHWTLHSHKCKRGYIYMYVCMYMYMYIICIYFHREGNIDPFNVASLIENQTLHLLHTPNGPNH